MKISFGNMRVELNIFNINSQPLEYDETYPMCFIEEITDDIDLEDPEIECFAQDFDDLDLDKRIRPDLHEPSLEDPDMECFAPYGGHFDLSEPLQHEPIYKLSLEDREFECFAQVGGNIDCGRILEPTREVVEPCLEDVELERFAQLGDDQYFDEVVELFISIIDPISELQLECGETMDLVFPTVYSFAFEPSDFIAESKRFAPIRMRPRRPILTFGRNDYFPPPFCDHRLIRTAGYSLLHIDHPSYDHHPFDSGQLVHTSLRTAIVVST
jgi:hypothetical protein